jgi:hypothetical protein
MLKVVLLSSPYKLWHGCSFSEIRFEKILFNNVIVHPWAGDEICMMNLINPAQNSFDVNYHLLMERSFGLPAETSKTGQYISACWSAAEALELYCNQTKLAGALSFSVKIAIQWGPG